ncbi:DMT family transporter [Ancylobacter radicis]|uniref:DMT family transporter n=1 Tax=Ancylobacter radicis TaxID=2836179 RepID=A0ABS5R922_9HYPH|nr:DMT family transporter [Ancylobacter radicis]MBS9478138.1 DMT family transporter [Ancylobacter radicis]
MHSSTLLRRGILLMIAGSCVFAANDAFSKLALAQIPPSQILAVRGVIAISVLLAVLGWKGEAPMLRYALDWRVLLRGATEAVVAVLFITAIVSMSIGDATAIVQIAPLATMAAAVMFFGSRINWKEWVAVGIGFVGVTLIIKPGTSAFDSMALLPLAAALLMAFRDFVTGRIGTHVPTLVVTFTTAGIGMLIGFAGSAVEEWHALDLTTLGYLLAGSVSLIGGHMLTIAAFRGNDPAVIAPFRYVSVLCAVGLSAGLFNALPDLVSIGGMALIMAAGLYSMSQHRPAPRVKVDLVPKPVALDTLPDEPRKAA